MAKFFILLLLLSLALAATNKHTKTKQKCASLESCKLDNTENCVNRCLSEACYTAVYAADPLQPGEIDKKRARLFSDCQKSEERESRKRRTEL